MKPVPRVLYVGGTDSGGGAGLLADIKACEANGAFACVAVTAATAQNTIGVAGFVGIEPSFIRAQMDAVFDDIGADAIKTGMLASREVICTVAAGIEAAKRGGQLKSGVVVDPVMVTANGDKLIDDDAVEAMCQHLLPLATLATPNRREAALLLGSATPPRTIIELREAATEIYRKFNPNSVVVKGGNADASDLNQNALRLDTEPGDLVVDVFYDGHTFVELASNKIETRNTHGTGCTLASAIAARLAIGDGALQAMRTARGYLDTALRASASVKIGRGQHGPFLHSPRMWDTAYC